MLLSYPNIEALKSYQDYLKIDLESYEADKTNVLENFTIYAYKFQGTNEWLKYSE